jgi:hypothetical protein
LIKSSSENLPLSNIVSTLPNLVTIGRSIISIVDGAESARITAEFRALTAELDVLQDELGTILNNQNNDTLSSYVRNFGPCFIFGCTLGCGLVGLSLMSLKIIRRQ